MRYIEIFDRQDVDFMVLAKLIDYCRVEAQELHLDLLEYLLSIARAEIVECLRQTETPVKCDA